MTWREIAEISELGFEIGNHSWSHADFSVPKNAARLAGELALVENELAKVGVDKPTSFAWCGNRFGPEAVQKLGELGIRLARRGLSPELDNRSLEAGPAYHPRVHDRLLIPTTGKRRSRLVNGQLLERAGPSGRGNRRPAVPWSTGRCASLGPHATQSVPGVHGGAGRARLRGPRLARSRETRPVGRGKRSQHRQAQPERSGPQSAAASRVCADALRPLTVDRSHGPPRIFGARGDRHCRILKFGSGRLRSKPCIWRRDGAGRIGR